MGMRENFNPKNNAKICFQLRETELELENEQRRHQETHKISRKQDRQLRELQFQVNCGPVVTGTSYNEDTL